MRTALAAAALLLSFACAKGQGSAGEGATYEPRYLIDLPTAGILPHAAAALDMDFTEHGAVLTTFSYGLWGRVNIGLSYGGGNIIGTGDPNWNKNPGFALRVRLIEESIVLPAIALGFDSQGKEGHIDKPDRYIIKSPGFYAVGSKNYSVLGYLSVHGGINYSLERDDGDDNLNFFIGAEKTLGPVFSFIGEYNLASNDSNHDALGRGRGYINAGLRISLGKGLSVGFNLKDLARNQQDEGLGNRTMMLEFVQPL